MPNSTGPWIAALALGAALLLPGAGDAEDFDWNASRPDTSGLARTQPEVEADADAEYLLHYTRVTDLRDPDIVTQYDHFVRLKIYTTRGAQDHGTVRIPYDRNLRMSEVRARTISPDGTVTPVESRTIFDRETLRSGRLRAREVSFAFPAVVPGSILEWRYRQSRDGLAHGLPLRFAAELPVVRRVWDVKPLFVPGVRMPMMGRRFGEGMSAFAAAGDGYQRTEARRLRALRTEPLMPGTARIEPWILVYYEPPTLDRVHFWRDVSRNLHRDGESNLRLDREQAEAARKEAGEGSPVDRLRRLYRRSREAVRIVDPARNEARPRADAGASEVLAFGAGLPEQVAQVFAAMCRAAGFDASWALVADRALPPPPIDFFDTFFYQHRAVAIRLPDSTWTFCDPGDRFLGFGELRWQQQGVLALLADPREPRWIETPLAPPSLRARSATFRVDADGVVEGDVRIESSGHIAVERRDELDGQSEPERERTIVEGVTATLPGAEVTTVVVEGLESTDRPLVERYHLRALDLAAVTGRQLGLQPEMLLGTGLPALTASTREYPIEVPFAFTHRDSIRIEIAEGMSILAAEAPAPLRAPGLAEYRVATTGSSDGRSIAIVRELTFGQGEMLSFPVGSYAPLQSFFQRVGQRDAFSVTFAIPVAAR